MFAKIGLAITFSPTGKALLKETARLQRLFNAQLTLIHVGEKSIETEKLFEESIRSAGIDNNQLETIWELGDPADTIIRCAKKAKLDLLVAGALEHESLVKYYRESVSRKIMHELETTSLILTSPSEETTKFKKFVVSVDYSPQCEKTIRTAFHFAIKEQAEEFTLIRDFFIPGLSSVIGEDKSYDEVKLLIDQLKKDEEEKMRLFVQELNLKGLAIKIICMYGREGFEESNYARNHDADIFAVTRPEKKTRFLDKLFQHDVEYTFEKLPSNLLIVK